VTFPAWAAPAGPLTAALFSAGTGSCGGAQPLHTWPAASPTAGAGAAWLALALPGDLAATAGAGPVFLRIAGAAGAPANFSDLFYVQPAYVPVSGAWSACSASCGGGAGSVEGTQTRAIGCGVNPAVPATPAPPVLPPFCSALAWNLTVLNTTAQPCLFSPNGCRNYR
jgi:hypothetical protein